MGTGFKEKPAGEGGKWRSMPDFLTRRDNDCEREILAGMPCRGAVKSAGKPDALQTLARYPERLACAQRLECGELAPAFERHEAGGQHTEARRHQ